MVEIGQTVMCTPGFSFSDNAGAGNKRKVRGTVVYIHPAGRFYIAGRESARGVPYGRR
nr:MAG TPA: Disulfide bond isomerase protein N-terminus [Caudoviricetes sp.]